MMLSIQMPAAGPTIVTGPTCRNWSSVAVDRSACMPAKDVKANNRRLPSTSSHVIGTLESTAPGMASRGAGISRADGSVSCCA